MDAVIEQMKKIGARFKEVEKLVLFGSRARNTHHSGSDYDIAVFTGSQPFSQKLSFYNAVEEIDSLYKIDVVIVDETISEQLLQNINGEGVLIMERENKRTNFVSAVQRLKEALEECGEMPSPLMRDGAIQRYEFCTELAWKACREYLMELGYPEVNGPKPVMKEAFSQGLIADSEGWIHILNDRNLSSHMYQEQVADEIFHRVRQEYMKLFEALARRFQAQND